MQNNLKNYLTGRRFGKLVVREYVPKEGKHNSKWLCDCDCGNQTLVLGGNLTRGITKSCGCLGSGRSRDEILHRKIRAQLDKGVGLTIRELSAATGYTEPQINSALRAMELEGNAVKEPQIGFNIWYSMKASAAYRVALAEQAFLYGRAL